MGKEFNTFIERIKEKRLKMTSQRVCVANKALTTHSHFTADELYEMVKRIDKSISRASVYRTLAILVNTGLLEKLDFAKGKAYYEHTLGHNHHDHLVCIGCGRISEFTSDGIEKIQEAIVRLRNFKPVSHSLKIYGLCARCKGGRREKGMA